MKNERPSRLQRIGEEGRGGKSVWSGRKAAWARGGRGWVSGSSEMAKRAPLDRLDRLDRGGGLSEHGADASEPSPTEAVRAWSVPTHSPTERRKTLPGELVRGRLVGRAVAKETEREDCHPWAREMPPA